MKYLFLILLCPTIAFAQGVVTNGTALPRLGIYGQIISTVIGAGTMSPPCSASDTAIPHDLVLQGFSTNDIWASWANVGSTLIDTNADSSSLTTGKVAGMCDTAMKFANTSSATETYMRYTMPATNDLDAQALDIVFYIYVTTPLDTSGELFTLFGANPTTSPSTTTAAGIELQFDGTDMRVRARGSTSSSYVALTASSWNKVKLHLDTATTGGASYLTVNDGAQQTFNRTADADVAYLHIGAIVALESSDAIEFYIDLLCVDTP